LASDGAKNAVGKIEEKMNALQISGMTHSNWILYIPALTRDGFAITIFKNEYAVLGQFGGLNIRLKCLPSAMLWVTRGLSSSYHLRTTMVGNRAIAWHLESRYATTANALSNISFAPLRTRLVRQTTVIRINGF
jgi:hypothetical protein